MQAVLRRSPGLVMAAAAVAAVTLAFAQPAHADNPAAPCGALSHKTPIARLNEPGFYT